MSDATVNNAVTNMTIVNSAAGNPAANSAIEVRDLSFAYAGAGTQVLSHVDWSVPEGAFALLVGSTGSGKSTLLSMLKPEISPAGERSGDALVLGRPVKALEPRESAQRVGYVFQSPDNQIVCECVWHEMAFGLENLGTSQDEMRRLVAETCYFFGMEDWLHADTDSLSGGRKQLLALAATLVMKPRVLLLDEPTAQLDPVAEKTFLHALFRVNRELGCTVVVATHAPRPMVPYATHAFRMVGGHVEELAGLDELSCRQSLLSTEREQAVGETRREATAATDTAAPGTAAATNATAATDAAASGTAATGANPRAPKPRSSAPRPLAVQLDRAWFRYERSGAWVLRGMDFRAVRGDIHALVGGNGCGKSTLLGVLAGTRKLQKGSCRIACSSKALLPQDPRALFVAETVAEELMEWARPAGYGSREVAQMLERLGLAGCEQQHPYDLSGGQQQLLALGKLLLVKPELLLLDEPTKGLDLEARRMLARVLTDLRTSGVAIVMATHDLDFVEQVASTVSMLFDGEVACTEPSERFFQGNVYYQP